MKDIPELIFVVDAYNEASIVDQANYNGIPVIALVNTNSDLTGINIAIPCNDESIRTIQLLVSKIADAVLEGKKI